MAGSAQVRFEACEYQADGSLRPARYEIAAEGNGWTVTADDERRLRFGPGYRLLETRLCGVCSTDLARRFLPFPLPQVTGHEVVAVDERGRRFAVEINASCEARGLELDCSFCAAGLERHCPDRRVLGIHDLPGGFGRYLLAPVGAMRPIPDEIPDESAVLIEPLAAALNAVTTIAPAAGSRVAVLGPRKLGLLCVTALDAWRRRSGTELTVVAIARRPELLELSLRLGADETFLLERGREAEANPPPCDFVIDTTGSPAGLEMAIRTARSEVHLKSTNGLPAAGMEHLTEMVVDEISLKRLDPQQPPSAPVGRDAPVVAWLAAAEPPPAWARQSRLLRLATAAAALAALEASPPGDRIPRADVAVVDSAEAAARAIRPDPGREVSLVRPRGWILLHRASDEARAASPLIEAVSNRGLRLTTSRCGDFDHAITLMRADPALRTLGREVVTHRFGAGEVAAAFEAAAGTDCIKAVVRH